MQHSVSGWECPSFRSRLDEPLDGRTIPREVVRRFEPARAGLPEISARDACSYIEARHAERPWLAAARGCPPEVQRVFAALDQGSGHGHIRHEGWVTEQMNERRVAYLEDPAQPDQTKRAAGIDGLRQDQPHRCRQAATRIADADAFAAAFARGVEHPEVRAGLDAAFVPRQTPRAVALDVSDLLGPEGHRYCTGWRLLPIDGSYDRARAQRAAWVDARANGRTSDAPAPDARPVPSFESGKIVFAFGPNSALNGYEVVTMYPRPRAGDSRGDAR